MKNKTFWDRVKRGCEIAGIPNTTFRTMKHRGRVSRDQIIPVHNALQGSDMGLTYEQLLKEYK